METAAAPAIRAVVVGSSGGPGPPITQQAITATTQQQHNNGNTVGHHHPPHQVYVQPHQRHSLMAPIVMHRYLLLIIDRREKEIHYLYYPVYMNVL